MQQSTSILKNQPRLFTVAVFIALLALVSPVSTIQAGSKAPSRGLVLHASSDDWTTYLGNNLRTGFNAAESTLTPGNVGSLKLQWSQFAAGGVSVEPVEANGVVYWGSWDGSEHAFTIGGKRLWDTNIGQTSVSGCRPSTVGVTSSATIGRTGSTPTLFVGGGNAIFYALNAATGAVIWSTRLATSPNHFLWASPLVVGGSVYIGVASFCDNPPVRGKFVQLDAATGAIENTFFTVPAGCTGGGVWGSPTLGESGNVIFIATGNSGPCSRDEPFSSSIIELQASDLSLVNSWRGLIHTPSGDNDFGSTPTIFNVSAGSGTHRLIGVAHKNGVYYAFNRLHLSDGPIWQVRIAGDNADCPQCGDGSISPSAWDGTTLYVAGGNTTINGISCAGSVRALNPLTGAFIWQHCLHSGPVLGAVTVIGGVVIVAQGTNINMLNAASGNTIFTFTDRRSGSAFFGGAAVAQGMVFAGNLDGFMYAFGL